MPRPKNPAREDRQRSRSRQRTQKGAKQSRADVPEIIRRKRRILEAQLKKVMKAMHPLKIRYDALREKMHKLRWQCDHSRYKPPSSYKGHSECPDCGTFY